MIALDMELLPFAPPAPDMTAADRVSYYWRQLEAVREWRRNPVYDLRLGRGVHLIAEAQDLGLERFAEDLEAKRLIDQIVGQYEGFLRSQLHWTKIPL